MQYAGGDAAHGGHTAAEHIEWAGEGVVAAEQQVRRAIFDQRSIAGTRISVSQCNTPGLRMQPPVLLGDTLEAQAQFAFQAGGGVAAMICSGGSWWRRRL